MKKINRFFRLKDLYLLYPYKKQTKNITRPYIKRKDIVEHEYQIDYTEYVKILSVYFKHLLEFLKTGYPYSIPQKMGEFMLVKKWVRFNAVYNKKGERKIFFNEKTNGFVPKIKWIRHRRSSFKLRSLYKFNLQKPFWRAYFVENQKNPSMILNLNEQ